MNCAIDIYKGKKVLVTGHTGFKGSWLVAWLEKLGAEVVGVSDDIPTKPSNYLVSEVGVNIEDVRLDVSDTNALSEVVTRFQPDFVFHLAAQALVRHSYEYPIETLTVNAIGSANVLDALRNINKPVVAVMITSDKVYDNKEWVWGYRETDSIGGVDPYSASKGMAELAIKTYVHSYFNKKNSNVRVGITRAGNVIGGGDWAKDRIVPDCMKAWSEGNTVDIRSPNSTRPWQHVLEPLSGYLALGVELYNSNDKHGQAYNFGPPANQNRPVKDLINEMGKHWSNIHWNDTSKDYQGHHEAGLLKLDCDKASQDLKWSPTMKFDQTIKMTVEWYKEYYQKRGQSMSHFTSKQIDDYMSIARDCGLSWAV